MEVSGVFSPMEMGKIYFTGKKCASNEGKVWYVYFKICKPQISKIIIYQVESMR